MSVPKTSAFAGLMVVLLTSVDTRAETQQYYGYAKTNNELLSVVPAIAALANGQAPGCAPSQPPGCTLPPIGCNITPCPPPPGGCLPSGSGTDKVCIIYCDQPPTNRPITLTVTRNYYVPIYIVNNGTPNVLPVNINYQWQPIHYLSDANGNPIDQSGKPLPNPSGLIPPPGTNPPMGGATPSPSAPALPSPQHSASTSSGPSAPTVSDAASSPAGTSPSDDKNPATNPAQASTSPAPSALSGPGTSTIKEQGPTKRWVWLADQRVFGYGYQRVDGYWVIDKGSKRATPPATAAAPQPQPVPTETASASAH